MQNTQWRPLNMIFGRKQFSRSITKKIKGHEKVQRHCYYILPYAE